MKKLLTTSSMVLLSALLLAGCTSNNTTHEQPSKKSEQKKETSHFTYTDQKGWKFEAGDSQSPVDIVPAKTEMMKDPGKLKLDYDSSILDEVDNGHSIQVIDKGRATIDGRQFELEQLHFHAKSEHTLAGKHFPIEAHFVHQAQDGRIAVIAIFLEAGKENQAFQTILTNLQTKKKNKDLPLEQLLPTNRSYYHYLGSLTTPPLSENVEWYVMQHPVSISSAQIKAFEKHYKANNRKTQPLHGRKILEHHE